MNQIRATYTATAPSTAPFRAVARHQILTFPAGESLYRAGELPRKLHVLQSGIVKLVVNLPSGRSRIIGFEGPGAVLGWDLGAGGCRPHGHAAVAVEPASSAALSLGEVRHLRAKRADEYIALLEQGVRQTRHAEHWLTEILTGNAPRRIARLIQLLMKLSGRNDCAFRLLTCQEFGEAVGVSTESASRILAQFKREGILEATPQAAGTSRYYRVNHSALDAIAFA